MLWLAVTTTTKKLGWSLERIGIEVTFIAAEPNVFPDVLWVVLVICNDPRCV